MASSRGNFRRAAREYMERTQRPLNCLLFILPLLAAYEAGALFFDPRLLVIQHLGDFLGRFGATGRFLPPVLVVAVLLTWHVFSRQRWQVDGGTLLGMLAEAVVFMVPLVLLAVVSDKIFSTPLSAGGPAPVALGAHILRGVGAGIYEEFLFRLAGISVVLFLLVDVMSVPKRYAAAAAVVLTSVAFSLYHFPGADSFRWPEFCFRAVAGVYLAGLYVGRGFGIAVGAHACYNVVAVLTR